MEVLKTVPFDKLDIRTLSVEYSHGKENDYVGYMKSKNYDMVKKLFKKDSVKYIYVDDYIFVKREKEQYACSIIVHTVHMYNILENILETLN